MKIDIFPHILPQAFLDYLERRGGGLPQSLQAVLSSRSCLYDLDRRLRVMDDFDDYVQVLTLSVPPIESLGDPSLARDLARSANDSMAEIVTKHADRFLGFAASLPLNDPEAAVEEVDRAIQQLGAVGVQIFTNVNGLPLDAPRFEPFFARMSALDRPIWVHPWRTPQFPDYASESDSKFGLSMAFGWPYETAIFMSRLVLSGHLDRYPNLRIITHHCGGMLPHFAYRIGAGLMQLPPVAGPGEPPADDLRAQKSRVLARYKRFYGDTALSGACHVLRASLTFFGPDHVVFGTDMPFDPENGPGWIRGTISCIDEMHLSPEEQHKIYEGNALRLLGRDT